MTPRRLDRADLFPVAVVLGMWLAMWLPEWLT